MFRNNGSENDEYYKFQNKQRYEHSQFLKIKDCFLT